MNEVLKTYHSKVGQMSAEGYTKAVIAKDKEIESRLKKALEDDAPKGCGAIQGAFRTAQILIEEGLVDESQAASLVRVLVVGRCVNASAQDKWLGNGSGSTEANASEV